MDRDELTDQIRKLSTFSTTFYSVCVIGGARFALYVPYFLYSLIFYFMARTVRWTVHIHFALVLYGAHMLHTFLHRSTLCVIVCNTAINYSCKWWCMAVVYTKKYKFYKSFSILVWEIQRCFPRVGLWVTYVYIGYQRVVPISRNILVVHWEAQSDRFLSIYSPHVKEYSGTVQQNNNK